MKFKTFCLYFFFNICICILDLGITEHIEGDETKFAVWTGRPPMLSDCRIVLKANSLETKQVRKMQLKIKIINFVINLFMVCGWIRF